MTIAANICCAHLKIDVSDTLFGIENFASYGSCVGVANSMGYLIVNKARDCFLHWLATYYLGQLNHFDAFVVKRNLKNFSPTVDFGYFSVLCNLKLAKSFIIRGIYLRIFGSCPIFSVIG